MFCFQTHSEYLIMRQKVKTCPWVLNQLSLNKWLTRFLRLMTDVCMCVLQPLVSNWFLTSCLLALVSAVPERHRPLGGSQTLRRRERGYTHSHTPKRKQGVHTFTLTLFFLHACTQTFTHSFFFFFFLKSDWQDLPMCALSEMINLFSQSFRPEHTNTNWVSTQTCSVSAHYVKYVFNSLFPLRSFFSASSNRPGRWITTPLPEAQKNKQPWIKIVKMQLFHMISWY